MIGRTLNHFRIDAKLGEGGMGVVYRATDEKLRREVALKVLPESHAADPERRSRFLREARAAAAVTHNNIATVHEIGEADGHVFIAMELVSGETLRERMGPGLSHAEAIRIAKEIARGLARAHEKGIVHRDLKPENVMVTPDGEVKILDFGLAKLLDVEPASASADTQDTHASHATAEGRVMGTPAYMSPEQAEGRTDLDARSDVFSFGVMLYEMLAGVAPFTGPTSVAIMYAVLHREPEALEVVCPDVPAGAVAVVAGCLKKPRQERLASGRDLVAMLDGEQTLPPLDTPSGKAPPAPTISTVSGMGTALGATIAADIEPAKADSGSVGGRPRRATLWAALGILALLGTVLGASAASKKHAVAGAELVPSGSASSAPRPITLGDLPLPPSPVPQARTEYAAGLQQLRDDNYASALRHFEKAAELDSSMAQAHLRIAIIGATFSSDRCRTALARAVELRERLDMRDRTLLDAVEPIVGRTTPDEALSVTRLRAAHERFPEDEEFVTLLAGLRMGDPVEGPAFARLATELDPRDGEAWETLGRSLALSGDLDGARRSLETCTTVSAESADCYWWLGILDGATGRCEEMERHARREADMDPDGNWPRAVALVALGRHEGIVREAINRSLEGETPEARPVTLAYDEARFAVLTGRFDIAVARLGEAGEITAAKPALQRDLRTYGRVAALRIEVLLETGNDIAARAEARGFADHVELMAHGATGTGGDIGQYWWITRAAGAPLDPGRRDWVERQNRIGAHKASTWLFAWALPATSRDEAAAALSDDAQLALPRGLEAMHGVGDADAAAGHVLLLAGKPAEAVPYLQRSQGNCFALEVPIAHVHAALDLGRALEQTHNNSGACDAYRNVLSHWGQAKPRSVSAEAARDGMKRLACAP